MLRAGRRALGALARGAEEAGAGRRGSAAATAGRRSVCGNVLPHTPGRGTCVVGEGGARAVAGGAGVGGTNAGGSGSPSPRTAIFGGAPQSASAAGGARCTPGVALGPARGPALGPARGPTLGAALGPAAGSAAGRRHFSVKWDSNIEWSQGAPRNRPGDRASPMKDPKIPDGHPIDVDKRPLGHVTPDYDVELPCFSWGGYTKDFKAWADHPPEFPSNVYSKSAMFDYDEIVARDTPPVYEVNLLVVANVLAALAAVWAIVATRLAVRRYYKQYADYYNNGWPCFHYNPGYDIVPLTLRADGLPPEFPVFDARDVGALEFLAAGLRRQREKAARKAERKAMRKAAKAAAAKAAAAMAAAAGEGKGEEEED